MKAKDYHAMYLKIEKFMKKNAIDNVRAQFDGGLSELAIYFTINGQLDYIDSKDFMKLVRAIEAGDCFFVTYDEHDQTVTFEDTFEKYVYRLREIPKCIPSGVLSRWVAAYYIIHNKKVIKYEQFPNDVAA
jgi:hypothetical protein